MDQYVHREAIERRLVGARREQAGEGVVAEIFEQQQAGAFIGGENGGSAEAKIEEMPRHTDEGAHVLAIRRRVHQHGPAAIAIYAVISTERCVAGEHA